ncbi:MAG: YggS family pyridoxal phosphate-dependent enzyme [Verrucomicrobia bacterium]|nr:YggS family pyridoxal phosphate-dependent enzyme [Verrucomicrobiota bacterium]
MSLKSKLSTLLLDIKKHATFDPVTLVCISKQVVVEKMLQAYELGIRDFGESRLQDALKKKNQLPQDVIWHFIGPIQSNKAKAIASTFDFVHSLASLKVAKIISETSLSLDRKMPVFIEVNLFKDPAKQGFLEEELVEVISLLQSLKGLNIKGFMTIAPHTEDAEKIRLCFHKLFCLSKQFGYPFLSMGMSQDYILALQEGATHLRIGSYLFKEETVKSSL